MNISIYSNRVFFHRIYFYYIHKGYFKILINSIVNLLVTNFLVLFLLFLFNCVDYHGLFTLDTKNSLGDYIFMNELHKHKLYNNIWQAYAALLPVKTVGVMGDTRTYENICLLRAVISQDGMTAESFNFSKEFLDMVSNKIVNGVPGINRVVYDTTSKPPGTIELE